MRRKKKEEEWLKVGLIVVLFVIAIPGHLPAAQEQAQKNVIEIKNNQMTLDVKDADLAEILKKIEKETSVKVVTGKEVVGKKITLKFTGLDVESALRKILGNNYIFVFYKDPADPKKSVLKEVMTVSDRASPETKIIVRTFKYGNGKDMVGAHRGREGASVGPSSFAVDEKGNFYICDTLNERIQIFSREGKYLSTIPLEHSTWADDMVLGQDGSVYVFDGARHILYQYNKKGEMISSVETNVWIGMPLYIADGKIYSDTCTLENECGSFPIGRIADGKLKSLTGQDVQAPVMRGTYGDSGKRYLAGSYRDTGEGIIDVIEKDGATRTITFPVKKGTGITHFLGQDNKGNIYASGERIEDDKYTTEVYKVDPKAYNYNSYQMSFKKPFFWPQRAFVVGKDGTIYRFLPEKNKLEIEVVQTESPGEMR